MTRSISVEESWLRLERWAEMHHPTVCDALAGPAESAAIRMLEGELGLQLPEGMRALLSRHDGQLPASELMFWPEGLAFLGCGDIEDRWRMLVTVESEVGGLDIDAFDSWAALAAEGMGAILGPVRALGMSKKWVPFAAGSRLHYLLDMNPAPGGEVGQVIRVDSESGAWAVLASSIEEYFATFVEKLASGDYPMDDYGLDLPDSERESFYERGRVPDYLAHVRWETPIRRETRLRVEEAGREIDVLVIGLSGSSEGAMVVAALADGTEVLFSAARDCTRPYSPRMGDLVRANLVRGRNDSLDYLADVLGERAPQYICTRVSMLRPRHLVNRNDPWAC